MKKHLLAAFAVLFLVLMGLGLRAATTPKNIFVSTHPEWKMEGLTGETYIDLQTAINKVGWGDTIWIQDGYVCETGKCASISGYGYPRVKFPNLPFTLRSESGYVDEANGKGAYIRGEPDPESEYADGRGPNAIRPIQSSYKLTVIQGLVLENGSTGDAHNYGAGGAVYGAAIISNCVIRNISAYCGAACGNSDSVIYNTVVSNCYAFGVGYGGGAIFGGASLYNCTIVTNGAAKCGGAIYYNNDGSTDYHTVYSNCVFRSNYSESYGAILLNKENSNTKRVRIVDCQILDNVATCGSCGGVCGSADLERCLIAGNQAYNRVNYNQGSVGGVCVGTRTSPQNLWPTAVDCVFSNNFTYCQGGGLLYGIASNCTFVGNWSCGNGGGAFKSVVTDCRFIGNVASNIVNSVNSEYGSGGGCSDCVVSNCLFVGNGAWAQNLVSSGNGGAVAHCDLYNCVLSNNWAVYRGAAVFNPNGSTRAQVCYNCLIVNNYSPAPHIGYDRGMIIEGEWANSLPTYPSQFYNCTIVGNKTENYAIVNAAELYNCIVWNNTAPGGDFYNAGSAKAPKYQVWCKTTCQKDLAAGTEDGNVNRDPRLTADYHLKYHRPCVDVAQEYDWMRAEGDIRAQDLDGKPRIRGAAPDMGCYEREPQGTLLLVR